MIGGPLLGGVPCAVYAPSAINIVADGNSILDPVYSTLVPQLQALSPLSGAFTISNFGLSGQTFDQMRTSISDVASAYVNGKDNILIAWEITNSVNTAGRTGLQACSDAAAYINTLQTLVQSAYPGARPWRVILPTAIPRGDFLNAYTAIDAEIQLQAANAYITANYRAMGASAYVNMRRVGGPFAFTDVLNDANFTSSGAYKTGEKTHPSPTGDAICAGYIADVLLKLPMVIRP